MKENSTRLIKIRINPSFPSRGAVCHHRDAEGTEKTPHKIWKRPFLCALCVSVVTYPSAAIVSQQSASSADLPCPGVRRRAGLRGCCRRLFQERHQGPCFRG